MENYYLIRILLRATASIMLNIYQPQTVLMFISMSINVYTWKRNSLWHCRTQNPCQLPYCYTVLNWQYVAIFIHCTATKLCPTASCLQQTNEGIYLLWKLQYFLFFMILSKYWYIYIYQHYLVTSDLLPIQSTVQHTQWSLY
jgi:hypothetical protein